MTQAFRLHKGLAILCALALCVAGIVVSASPASARPSIEYTCKSGYTLSGKTCVSNIASCPAGYTYFAGDATTEPVCVGFAIDNFTACPPGGSPNPATVHNDGRIKNCIAPVINGDYPAKRTKFCAGRKVTVDLTKGQQPTSGRDVIWGTRNDDLIFGRSGGDIICGRGGDDTIYGSRGRDRIFGNSGDDIIYGGSFKDRLFGGSGNDRIYGQTGDDYINGGSGFNLCSGGRGADTIKPGTCF